MFRNNSNPLESGRWRKISLPRRFIMDLMHFSQKIPLITIQRKMDLQGLVEARNRARVRISWYSIFIKAYAIVAQRYPEFRRIYMPVPWPHFYEHPCSVASFTVEKEYRGEQGVFFGQIHCPEQMPIHELNQEIKGFRDAEIESVPSFRSALRLSSLPMPIRRLLWWLGLNLEGPVRARFFGTFGISVVSALGSATNHLLSPMTTTLNYGVLGDEGSLDVKLTFDHRVMDGAVVARAMEELEEVLRHDILDELEELRESSNRRFVFKAPAPMAPMSSSSLNARILPR